MRDHQAAAPDAVLQAELLDLRAAGDLVGDHAVDPAGLGHQPEVAARGDALHGLLELRVAHQVLILGAVGHADLRAEPEARAAQVGQLVELPTAGVADMGKQHVR